MTRRPRREKARKKPLRKNRQAVKRARPPKLDPLDAFITAAAGGLDLEIDKSWMPVVRGHLQVTLRHGALVTAFALPDDAEPAPAFKA